MKSVIQRVINARVIVEEKVVGKIEQGILALVGFTHGDSSKDVDWHIEKMCNLRIFEDAAGKMNLSLGDIEGSLLLVSQFTLYGDCSKGRRPSFVNALDPEKANKLYDYSIDKARATLGDDRVATGRFGAHMKLDFVNDGPITLCI